MPLLGYWSLCWRTIMVWKYLRVASQRWAAFLLEIPAKGLCPWGFSDHECSRARTSPVKKRVLGRASLLRVSTLHLHPPMSLTCPQMNGSWASLGDMLTSTAKSENAPNVTKNSSSVSLIRRLWTVGELRTLDLADRPIADLATFPDGSEGAGLKGLWPISKADRQRDFLEQLAQKLFTYAMGRAFIPSDELFSKR